MYAKKRMDLAVGRDDFYGSFWFIVAFFIFMDGAVGVCDYICRQRIHVGTYEDFFLSDISVCVHTKQVYLR